MNPWVARQKPHAKGDAQAAAAVHVLDRGVHVDVPHDDQPEPVERGDLRQSVRTLQPPITQHITTNATNEQSIKCKANKQISKQAHTPA